MAIELRPYQVQQVEELRSGFRSGVRRQLLQAPTGAGKTVVFCFMTSEAVKRGLRVMILAHRSEILDQIDETLSKFGIIAGHVRSGLPMDKSKPVLVASVQTLVRRLDQVPDPDFVIVDEAHHAAAGQWVKVFARYSKSKFVGVTATPERLSGEPLSPFFDRLVLGPEVSWLIDNGFLKRPSYFGSPAPVDLSGVHKVGGDFNKSELERAVNTGTITGDAVSHYRKFGRDMPAVAFCVNLNHANTVCQQFCSSGIPAEVIDGTMDSEDRRGRKSRLADGTTQVMVSCELISEGFDLPAVGCAILLRPTASLGLHLQQLGRALRPHSGQTGAVILDHAGNCLRHGPAEEHREWSLDGHASKKSKREVDLVQCQKCYAMYRRGEGPPCPQCGHEPESNPREIIQQEGQLKELSAEELMARRNRRMEEWKCTSYEEFAALGKARGFKPGWAHFRWINSRHYHNKMSPKTLKKPVAPELSLMP